MQSRSFSVQHTANVQKKTNSIAQAKKKLLFTLITFSTVLTILVGLILWHIQQTLHYEVMEHYRSWSIEIAREVNDVLLDQALNEIESLSSAEPIYPRDNFNKISFTTLLPPSLTQLLHLCLLEGESIIASSRDFKISYCDKSPLTKLSLTGPYKGFFLQIGITDELTLKSQRIVLQLCIAFSLVLIWGVLVVYQLAISHLESAKQQSDFVSAVSHELRTPLTTIRMHSESLEQDWIDEEKRKDYYSMIRQETERLSRLIENVLTLSGIQEQTSLVDIQQTTGEALRDLLKDIAEPLCDYGEFELELIVDPGEEILNAFISLDRDRTKQIVINLVDNAIKFSQDAKERKLQIGLKLLADENGSGESLAIFVRDFGPGIDESQQKLIFDLFYRAEDESTRTSPGTGIGLGLAYELARSMGAKLKVQNAHPGAEFHLVFKNN